MALTFYVENQLHERLHEFADDSENSFLNLCRRMARDGSKVVDIIDLYTDTMFNFIQLDRLTKELGELPQDSLTQPERRIVAAVMEAAAQAREISGYLFILGD